MTRRLGVALVLLAGTLAGAGAVDVPILNPQFALDAGDFVLPAGWNLLGDAGVGSAWQEDRVFFLDVSNTQPAQDCGVHQMVAVTPGHRYRLSADAATAYNELQVVTSIGLATQRSLRTGQIAWSSEYSGSSWTRLSVEAVCWEPVLAIVLRQRNPNTQWPSLIGSRFDNVRLEDLGPAADPTPTNTPQATTTPPGWRAPANDVYAIGADLRRLAYEFEGVRTRMHASTALAGQHPNQDYNNYQGTVVDGGRTWQVLHESHQPGALLRIWTTGLAKNTGRIRIYLDDTQTPAVDMSIVQFMSGYDARWPRPFASPNSGAWANYMPMPYRSYCRVQVVDQTDAGLNRYYYQVTYQDFDTAEGMPPFPPASGAALGNARRMETAWSTYGYDPKPPDPAAQAAEGTLSLAPGETKTFWSTGGIGRIDQIWIDPVGGGEALLRGLRLLAFWDRETNPSVYAPVGLFFGTGYGEQVARTLMVGMTPTEGFYCYFPMLYGDGAVLRLRNESSTAINNLRYKVVHAPRPALEPGELRFHAEYDYDPNAGAGGLYVPLEIDGRGHFCGVTMGLQGKTDSFHFLEGDEHIFVDGETAPSIMGTGAEDYFTCGWYFFRKAMCFPLYGCTEVIQNPVFRVSAYRHHITDYIPFTTSFRFGLEVGDHEEDPQSGIYHTVSYYYLMHGTVASTTSNMEMY